MYDCCLRRVLYKNKFEMTYVGLSQVSRTVDWGPGWLAVNFLKKGKLFVFTSSY